MIDGGMVPTVDGFREAKLGICFPASAVVETSENRSVLLGKRFFGDICAADEFGRRTYAAARREGVTEDGSNCEMLGDGAKWIWNLKAEHLPRATETVDWHHATDHVSKTAHALHGEGTAKAEAWTQRQTDNLWNERLPLILAALGRTRPHHQEGREAVMELRRYLTDNRERMHYASRRERDLLVGSGAMEGGISYVLQDRLKRTGMRWSLDGSRRVLALRLRWTNDEWDSPTARPAMSARWGAHRGLAA